MSRQKSDLTEGVRALVARDRTAWGDHPAPETLAAYHAGRLPDEEAEALRDHLSLCAECGELVLDLARLPELGEAGEEAAPQPDAEMAAQWRALQRRLASEAELRPARRDPEEDSDGDLLGKAAPLPHGSSYPPVPRPHPFPSAWRLLAAALGGVVLGCGLWALVIAPQGRGRPPRPQSNVPLYQLEPIGSGHRGPGGAAARGVPSPARPWETGAVLLLFGVGDLTYPDYEVSLYEADVGAGGEIFRLRGLVPDPREGVFTVGVPPGYLPLGRYRIELQGLGRGEPRLLAEYRLPIGET